VSASAAEAATLSDFNRDFSSVKNKANKMVTAPAIAAGNHQTACQLS
jgi:hypothetical protein